MGPKLTNYMTPLKRPLSEKFLTAMIDRLAPLALRDAARFARLKPSDACFHRRPPCDVDPLAGNHRHYSERVRHHLCGCNPSMFEEQVKPLGPSYTYYYLLY